MNCELWRKLRDASVADCQQFTPAFITPLRNLFPGSGCVCKSRTPLPFTKRLQDKFEERPNWMPLARQQQLALLLSDSHFAGKD